MFSNSEKRMKVLKDFTRTLQHSKRIMGKVVKLKLSYKAGEIISTSNPNLYHKEIKAGEIQVL